MKKLNLEKLREKIDIVDENLMKVLAKRFALTKMVGEYKKTHKLKALAKNREEQIFKQREVWANELQLSPILIKQLFTTIIKEVRKNHREIKKKYKSCPRTSCPRAALG